MSRCKNWKFHSCSLILNSSPSCVVFGTEKTRHSGGTTKKKSPKPACDPDMNKGDKQKMQRNLVFWYFLSWDTLNAQFCNLSSSNVRFLLQILRNCQACYGKLYSQPSVAGLELWLSELWNIARVCYANRRQDRS